MWMDAKSYCSSDKTILAQRMVEGGQSNNETEYITTPRFKKNLTFLRNVVSKYLQIKD